MKKEIIPDFYRDFVCSAGDCPDTCCKSWDIVVDDETLEFYEKMADMEFLSNLYIDDDGDMVIRLKDSVCPFLNRERLCSVQIKYGAENICGVCREFPRITQDYTEFEERLLTLACPEAARLMITGCDSFGFISDLRVLNEDNGYDRKLMNFLLHARYLTAGIFRREGTFTEKMCRCLVFSEYVQQLLDGEELDESRLSVCPSEGRELDVRLLLNAHCGLDVMDGEWLSTLISCDVENLSKELDGEFSSLALYYIARYYLTAVSDWDIITTIKRICCAYAACGALISFANAECDVKKRTLIYQKYSKEIEHSDENTDYLRELFLTDDYNSDNIMIHRK